MSLLVYVGAFFNYVFQIAMAIVLAPDSLTVILIFNSLLIVLGVIPSAIQTSTAQETVGVRNELATTRSLWVSGNRKFAIYGVGFAAIIGFASVIWAPALDVFRFEYVVLFTTSVFLMQLLGFNRGVLQGLERVWWFGISLTSWSVLRLIAAVALVKIGLEVSGVLLGYVVGYFAALVITFLPLKSSLSESTLVTHRPPKIAWNPPIYLSILFLSILSQGDIFVARHFLSTYEAASFAVVSILSKASFYAVASVSLAMFPKAVDQYNRGEGSKSVIVVALAIASIVCGTFVLAYGLFSEQIIDLLFGGKYDSAHGHIFVYSLAMSSLGISYLLAHYLLALGKNWIPAVLGILVLGAVTLVSFGPTTVAELVRLVSWISFTALAAILSITVFTLLRSD
ncbi:hypothetical protein FIL93_00020 [SAR202 cluster bacterium AD-493-K16_JPT_193m]|nr:hypothetical protein [SAR202 cluster bacterium AD-493-K16_JPT_193m]